MITVSNIEYDFDGLVFLDIDGVLNSNEWSKYLINTNQFKHGDTIDYHAYVQQQLDPKAICCLNRILKTYNLGIVLSSSWRYSTERIGELSKCGIHEWDKRYFGRTGSSEGVRGQQIQSWILKNNYTGPFVILDDDDDMKPLMKHWVETKYLFGLKEEHIKEVGEKLKIMETETEQTLSPSCAFCGEPMQLNVPRLGPYGGWVHTNNHSYACDGEPLKPLEYTTFGGFITPDYELKDVD
jgi:hypothetical protein